MPFKAVGNKVMVKRPSGWKVKQTCKSAENAQKAVRLLYAKTGGK